MLYRAVEEFSNIVTGFSVSEHGRYGAGMSFVANIQFIDASSLHIKDYLFLDGKRKYSYHWQDAEGNLISRWDNSPHHSEISTYPHHRHTSNGITESNEWNIREILKIINGVVSPAMAEGSEK